MTCPSCGRDHVLYDPEPLAEQARRPDGSKLPAPMTPGRAANFVLGFGKHKGKALACIAAEDPGYIEWAATGLGGSTGRAVQFFLDWHGKAS